MKTLDDDRRAAPGFTKFDVNGTALTNKLPALLRLLGAVAVIVAMYSFIAKGWESGNDVYHYLLLLGHTAALAVIGLASGHWLKEGKGARLLLSLALVSVPANFAVLGAFLYSQLPGVDVSRYPHYVAWTTDSLQTALFVVAGAMPVLVPVTLVGFTVLARSLSRKLSVLFLISNAMLLLPVRDPHWIGWLVLGLLLGTVVLSHRALRSHTAARTREGITALILQALPMAVLVGRSLWLYSADLFLISVIFVALYFTLRQIALHLDAGSVVRKAVDALSALPAAASGLWLGAALNEAAFIPHELAFPCGGLVSAALLYDLSLRSVGAGELYRRIATLGLTVGMIANLLLYSSLLAAMACVIVGLVLLVFGYMHQQSRIFIGGVVLMLAAIAERTYELVHHFDLHGWLALAVLGIVAIVFASVMETQGGNLKLRLSAWRDRFRHWKR